MPDNPLTVAWISDFPLEWLPDLPEPLRHLPRRHPATWQMVLLAEFEKDPKLKLHVLMMRHRITRDFVFDRHGVTFHVLKLHPAARVGTVFWADTLVLRRACRQIQPRLVHAWGMEKAAGLIARRLGYPHLMTVQGLFAWYKERVPLQAYDRFIERLERYTLPRLPVVTTESNYSVHYLKAHYPRLQVCQAEHAPNHAFFRVQRQPQTTPMHFLSMGALGFRKGGDLLFRALDQLAPKYDFRLTIISGPNPGYLDQMRPTVSESFWRRLEFKHHILPHEVALELRTPTMMLLPTRADVSPNAVKESAVAGVPVLASETGGIPDYIRHGKNGLLFPPGDLETFKNTIEKACADPLFSRGLVDPETLAATREYLSPERMARNFWKAYELALRAKL